MRKLPYEIFIALVVSGSIGWGLGTILPMFVAVVVSFLQGLVLGAWGTVIYARRMGLI